MAKGAIPMKPDEEWAAENDLRTLLEAEKIEKDPKRFKAAKEMAKQKLLMLASVASDTD
jgi:hypothetical protein